MLGLDTSGNHIQIDLRVGYERANDSCVHLLGYNEEDIRKMKDPNSLLYSS